VPLVIKTEDGRGELRIVAKQKHLGAGKSRNRYYCPRVYIDEGIEMLIGYSAAKVQSLLEF
jgi:hypothetical protein